MLKVARKAGTQRQKITGADTTRLRNAYRIMTQARLCDEKIIILYKQNKCHFQIGTAGHEACQVAAAQLFNPKSDWFYPYYRDMAFCAGIGMTSREFMLNALNKAADPNSHGRQMPMHYGHKDLNIVNQSSPTGTQYLQAVGCALASKSKGLHEVTYVSSGEGTCSQGDFHEAINWASRDKLPVLFLIQNNDFAISVHVSEQLAGASVFKFTKGYEGLAGFEVDGTNYFESREAIKSACERALRGDGPSLIEAHVPRLQSHSISDNHLKYRTAEQVEGDSARDPLPRFANELIAMGVASQSEIEKIKRELLDEVNEAAEWAETQSECSTKEAIRFTFTENDSALAHEETEPEGEELYLVDALNHALDEELQRDRSMMVFGQDVAYGKGGVFGVTAGLTDKHGDARVFNAPLAESSIIGVAIGLATRGIKAVPEIQFGDYVWTGMMQIRNELALMHYRSGGDWSCPVVVRIPVGGYIHGGCYHSQNIEATFAHFPGLHVVYPSNAADAKGLLKGAIRGNNPVLFLEHKGLYRQVFAKGKEGGKDFCIPLGKAKVVREGTDLTIVTWGALVQKSILAARALAENGKSVEVIDLRSIVPLDGETIFASVRKTGRVLIAHEDILFMGFGAELAAQISEECFLTLDAPISRLGMKYAAAVPHSPALETVILPQNEDVLRAAKAVLDY